MNEERKPTKWLKVDHYYCVNCGKNKDLFKSVIQMVFYCDRCKIQYYIDDDEPVEQPHFEIRNVHGHLL